MDELQHGPAEQLVVGHVERWLIRRIYRRRRHVLDLLIVIFLYLLVFRADFQALDTDVPVTDVPVITLCHGRLKLLLSAACSWDSQTLSGRRWS